jgi:hypothetical protein
VRHRFACATDEPEDRRYQLTDQILTVRHDASEVVIKHEDLPRFMPGMTRGVPVAVILIHLERSRLDGERPRQRAADGARRDRLNSCA